MTATLTRLLRERTGGTLCPSEVARALRPPMPDEPFGSEAWREFMPAVHAAAARLVASGGATTSWRGEPRAIGDGPYRLALRKD